MPTTHPMISTESVVTGDQVRRARVWDFGPGGPALRLVAALATLALAACTGINLDPVSHREFPRASAAETAPPPELANGTAQ